MLGAGATELISSGVRQTGGVQLATGRLKVQLGWLAAQAPAILYTKGGPELQGGRPTAGLLAEYLYARKPELASYLNE